MPYRHNKERKVSVQHRYPDDKTEKEKGEYKPQSSAEEESCKGQTPQQDREQHTAHEHMD